MASAEEQTRSTRKPLWRSINRRTWLTFLLGNLTGALVVAGIVALLPPSAEREELEPGELVILSGRDDSVGDQRSAMIELWNASHPLNPARLIPLNEAANGQRVEMVNRAQNDAEIDIFNLDVTFVAEFAEANWLRPIDEKALHDRPEEVFLANPLETCRYGGKLWALPFNTDAGLLFYRKDLGLRPPFDSYDWSRITAESERILSAKAPGSPLGGGYTGQLDDYEGLTANALEAIWANSGEVRIDAQGQVSVDRERWTEALRRLTPGPVGDPKPSVVHPDSLGFDETRSREAFRAGKVLFMRNWPVAYRNLSAADDTDGAAGSAPPTPIQFGVTKLPGPSALGGQNLAIAKKTRQPKAAQALIEFLTGQESQRNLFERGGFAATRADVYQDAMIARQVPYVTLLLNAVNGARLRPVSPYYDNFSRVFRRHVRMVIDGGILPDDIDHRLTEALKGR